MKRLKLIAAIIVAAVTFGCQDTPETETDLLKTDISGDRVTITSEDEGEQPFQIISNMHWVIEKDADDNWIEFKPSDGYGNQNIVIDYDANESEGARTAHIRIVGTDQDGDKHYLEYNIVQIGHSGELPDDPILSTDIPEDEYTLPDHEAGSFKFQITSNLGWDISWSATEWMTVSPVEGDGNAEITVSYLANEGKKRSSEIVIEGEDEHGQSLRLTYNVTQPAKPEAPQPPKERVLILGENFGENSSSKYAVTNDYEWQRSGTAGPNVVYSYEGDTDKPLRNSTPSVNYEGVSGGMNLYSANKGEFVVSNIEITGAESLNLSVGTISLSSDLKVEYSFDGTTWNAFVATEDKEDSGWDKITYGAVSSTGQANVTIRFTFNKDGRIDDLILMSGEGGVEPPKPTYHLSVDNTSYTHIAHQGVTGRSIEVISNIAWTVSTQGDWFSVTPSSGSGSRTLSLTVTSNSSVQPRQGTITLKSTDTSLGVEDVVITVGQNAYSETNTDQPYEWLELPSVETDDQTQFVTHFANVDGKKVRNYSMLYDKKEKIAYWVAYPMHAFYTKKNVKRTNKWAYDPIVANSDQINLSSSYGGSYSRGHQVASSDRMASRELNEQTFFYTNMTPQIGNSFNGNAWNKLEIWIREHMPSDTLYLVTGATLKTVGNNETVKYVKSTAIPNYYYKVMMKRKGNGFTGIGFWYDHKACSDQPSVKHAKSIREIENLTGFDFFSNIPKDLQEAAEIQYYREDWGL